MRPQRCVLSLAAGRSRRVEESQWGETGKGGGAGSDRASSSCKPVSEGRGELGQDSEKRRRRSSS